MTVNNVKLEAVCGQASQFPCGGLPEVAFAGRSNVGKSSLINCMVSRKALARASGSPGKTRTINFYNVENAVMFVDLPGYGYARAPKTEIEKWGKLIERYLTGREELRAVLLLVDSRHEPSENDKLMLNMLRHYGLAAVVVATKADKLARGKVAAHLSVIRKALAPGEEPLLPFSSETRAGRDELWAVIERFLV